jgi:hypothetical protein
VVCRESATAAYSLQASIGSSEQRLQDILRSRDTPAAFDWMMESFNFQGISDSVANSFMDAYGSITWHQLSSQFKRRPSCPLLDSHWTYTGCRYDKTRRTCSHPHLFADCSVSKFSARNGHLGQTAFSLFLFVRDIAGSDLFTWIEDQLSSAIELGISSRQEALIGPMRHIFGVSDKVLAMTLSSLLMADRRHRPDWFEVGSEMIVVDRLVHNFLARTGILSRFEADHPYGPRCYGADGCADILRLVSAQIDARQFDATFPADFPRYTQHAVWRYCAADALNICNGNNIDDRKSCEQSRCILHGNCGKKALKGSIRGTF